jgi:hypothetical protein
MTIPLNDPMTLSFVEMNGASEISQGILGWISIISGWCFQTCFFSFFFKPFHIWDVILPIDFHIFQDG